jgi:hypothetical protein
MADIQITDYGQPTPPEGEQTWDTQQLQEDFEVKSFLAPYVLVRRKSDGVEGLLEFTHSPRLYFNFTPR